MTQFETDALSPLNKAEETQKLLNAISTRLSGRADCNNQKYIVAIDFKGVTMSPLVQVYPSRHRRAESDKLDIISYVHRYKLQNLLLDQLEFGIYEYSAEGNKRRRWKKVI